MKMKRDIGDWHKQRHIHISYGKVIQPEAIPIASDGLYKDDRNKEERK